MKIVIVEFLMMKLLDVERIFVKEIRLLFIILIFFYSVIYSLIDRMDSLSFLLSGWLIDSVDDIVNRIFLDFLMDFVI